MPDDDPWFAQCVARAPGAPTHVLLDDRIAEHVPGCNCAFRTHALAAIGGFNPLFRRAGDDVDVCWRIQAQGWKIGFAPAALAWHRHRATTRAYWRQQIGYGEGETWLMREHPDKFVGGRIDWHGHIYSPLPFVRSLRTRRINTGPFGTAGFPSVYRTDARAVSYLPHSGRWQIAWIVTLAAAAGSICRGGTARDTAVGGGGGGARSRRLRKCAALRAAHRRRPVVADRPLLPREQPCHLPSDHRLAALRPAVRASLGPRHGVSSIGPKLRAVARKALPSGSMQACGSRKSPTRFACSLTAGRAFVLERAVGRYRRSVESAWRIACGSSGRSGRSKSTAAGGKTAI